MGRRGSRVYWNRWRGASANPTRSHTLSVREPGQSLVEPWTSPNSRPTSAKHLHRHRRQGSRTGKLSSRCNRVWQCSFAETGQERCHMLKLRARPESGRAIEGFGVGALFRQMACVGDRNGAFAILDEKRMWLPVSGRPNSRGSWLIALMIEGLVMPGEQSQAEKLPG